MDYDERRTQAIKKGHYLSGVDQHNIVDVELHSNPASGKSWETYRSSESTDCTSKTFKTAPWHRYSTASRPFRASLLPPPLNVNRQSGAVEDQDYTTTQPLRVYGGAASKIKQHFGVDQVEVDFSHIDPHPPRPPSRTYQSFQRSLRRVSLTPGEILYPISINDSAKAEEMLGLRRHSRAPTVPARDPRRAAGASSTDSSSSDSTGSLPSHKGHLENDIDDSLNGRTAWLHSLMGMLIVFNCWGLSNAFGLFQAYYERVHLPNSSPSAIAWIGSTQLALVFGLGVPVGRLVDKGYFRLMFHGGSIIMVSGIFLSSVCKSLWTLWFINGLITGLGMGMCFCSGIVALMTWFDEKKIGLAMGLGAAGSCVGGIVYIVLARHFLKSNGFKTTMLILGGVAAVTMIPPNVVFRVRGQKHQSRPGRRGAKSFPKQESNWRSFTEISYLLAAGGMFFAFLGVYFGFVYIITFASTVLHLSDTASTNLLIFMLAANLPGRFVPALISDRCIGPLNTIIPSTLLSSGIIWLWAASGEHQGSLTIIACFYGFLSAGVQVLYAPTVYSFCLEPVGRQDTQLAMDRVGVKAGGIFSCIGVACLIGLPIGGALISYRTEKGMDHSFLGAQVFAGVCLLLGGLLLLASRVAKAGWAAKRA